MISEAIYRFQYSGQPNSVSSLTKKPALIKIAGNLAYTFGQRRATDCSEAEVPAPRGRKF